MNVDRRWWGTSVLAVRILFAGLVLLATGCAILGWGTRFGKSVRNQDNILKPLSAEVDSAASSQVRAQSILAGLPLIFEPNRGQDNLDPADARAQFVTHGSGYRLILGNDGALLTLISHPPSPGSSRSEGRFQNLEMKIAGASSLAHLTGADPLPGNSNYFIGNDPAKWRTGVPQFARVRYENVYPGISLVFYGKQGHLEYDFEVSPGADPSQAELEFRGARNLELNDGLLIIRGENGSVQLEAPSIYQEINERKTLVGGSFVLRAGNRVGFALGAYDHSRQLIIDPILNFSTFFGGSGDEHQTSVTVDGSLNIYLSGSTTSSNLPVTPGVFQGTLAGAENVYIAKIQPPLGSIPARLESVTYLGGSGTDYPVGIAVDGAGDPFVAGTTTSGNFPTTATAYQPSPASAGTHVFVTKLKFDFTSLDYSSYLSGNGTDIATGMTTDSQFLYVTGTTTSIETSAQDQFPATNIPNTLGYQTTTRATAGTPQFFVTKVNPVAQGIGSIPYSTYFGGGTFSGTVVATGGGVAVDTNQNVYFTGTTNFTYTGVSSVTDFPILNAYQPCLNSAPPTTIVPPQTCPTSSSGAPDAFVAKLNTSGQGQQLVWSTYVGGTGSDSGTGVAVDSGAANVYVVGTTNSTDIVNSGLVKSFAPYQACLNNITLTPASGTVTCDAQPNSPPSNDAFVARLSNPSTTTTGTPVTVALGYFSYVGGSNDEAGTAIAADSNSGALITGSTTSTLVPPATAGNPPQAGSFPVFPYPSSVQSSLNGTQNAFVARLNSGATVGQTTIASWATYFGGNNTDTGTSLALDVNQNTYVAGDTNSTAPQFPVAKALQAQNNGGYDAFLAELGTAVSLSINGVLTIGTGQQFISAGNPATFTYTVTNNGPDLASNIAILADFSHTGIPVTNVSATISSGTCGSSGSTNTSISCGPVSLQSGSTATVTITLTPSATNNGTSPVFFNGGTVQAISADNVVLAQTSVPAQMTDFLMSVSPGQQAIPVAGATATYTVQLTPQPVYSSSITVSCSGLPAAASCSPKTVSLPTQSGASVAMAITTTARPVTTPAASLFTRHFYALWLMIPGMALVGAGGKRRRGKIFGFLTLCVMFTLVLLIPACSSSKSTTPVSGTPAGNYTITLTAAAGSDSKSQTVTLTVP
ncbi:MAG TPA: SBBP repeat-containing protein [Candidatus Sulfotelmatobacter sp.]|nr:SBBP repeat-containing protein [Candidatus Sulfotelmatobacter sp.]